MRRVRRCPRCGYEENRFELPAEDIEEYVRIYDSVMRFREITSSLQLNEKPAPDVPKAVREILGLSA